MVPGQWAERSAIDLGCCKAYLQGGEGVGRGENRSRTTCPNSKHEEKPIIDTRIRVQTSMSSTAEFEAPPAECSMHAPAHAVV